MGNSKAVLRREFIVTSAYIKSTERFQINDLRLHSKVIEKQKQAKLKTSRREIIKSKSQNQQNRDQEAIQRINKTKKLVL
jgi:hypothetical protein